MVKFFNKMKTEEKVASQPIPLYTRLERIVDLIQKHANYSSKLRYYDYNRGTSQYLFDTALGTKLIVIEQSYQETIEFKYKDYDTYKHIFTIKCSKNTAKLEPMLKEGMNTDSIHLALYELEKYLEPLEKEYQKKKAYHDSQVRIIEQQEGFSV